MAIRLDDTVSNAKQAMDSSGLPFAEMVGLKLSAAMLLAVLSGLRFIAVCAVPAVPVGFR